MKSTKRSLIASALSMVLCVMLLFGTSLAWFSATLETDANELYAGNLAVKLYYSKTLAEENPWTEVKAETTDLFKINGSDMLWEPGATNVVYLKLENLGSLKMKYQLSVLFDENLKEDGAELEVYKSTNVEGKPFSLADYILIGAQTLEKDTPDKYENAQAAIAAVKDNVRTLTDANGQNLVSGNMSGKRAEPVAEGVDDPSIETFALVLYMPENSQNEANYAPTAQQPKVPLRLKLVATQDIGEKDSFTDKYDENATFPESVGTQAELTEAINKAAEGSDTKITLQGNIALTEKLTVDKNITFVGNGSTISKYPVYIESNSESGRTVTFRNVKFDDTTVGDTASSVYAIGFKGTLVFDGCEFGKNNWESLQITPTGDCTIEFKNCTFNGADSMRRFIHIQPAKMNNHKLNVTITGCTFNNCELVNYKTGEGASEQDKGTVIDLDYFCEGSTITMGGNEFICAEDTVLHPYFCVAGGTPVIEGDALLPLLTGEVKTYTVTAEGLKEGLK